MNKASAFLFIFTLLICGLTGSVAAAASSVGEGRQLNGIVDLDYAYDGNGSGIALDKNGTVWYWDGNEPAKRGPSAPGAINVTSRLLLKEDGTVWEWKEGTADIIQVPGLIKIKKIASSRAGSIALDGSGKLWAWGQSCQVAFAVKSKLKQDICMDYRVRDPLLDQPSFVIDGVVDADIHSDLAIVYTDGLIEQLYYGDNVHYGVHVYRLPGPHKAMAISEGAMFTNRGALIVLATDGSLWRGYDGGLEAIAGKSAFKSIDAGVDHPHHSLALDSNGQVWGIVEANTVVSSKLKGLTGIHEIAARPFNSGLALDAQGRVWYWGGADIDFSGKVIPLNTAPKVLPVQRELTVTWNGTTLPLTAAPVLRDNAVLIPMRELFEAFGAKVEYDNGRITATRDGRVIELTVYSKTVIVDGTKAQMSTPPIYVNGRTYVPLRFLSQSLGAAVQWNAALGDASIVLN
ncbi:hypothetical protein PAECIP111893_02051 [Paenibacillus plantiphilus]|uniref:Copper amine oxidase-like N-terminal domain-containing protein n=1 Tax=Paenibacillus plantiphilus TaxID=2905650 RepID=A0ABN8G9U1_9BACL|nr:copper amine oxidase N-terminal domain-containing protein [Paenibacillus plantiphilus]CAH1203732.1 hypothetical protein PAECIP111893_02051 [Paenibacillus plantiphilus]